MNLSKVSITPPADKKPWAVRIEWDEHRTTDADLVVNDERTLKSDEAPHPAFLAALQALRPAVADACLLTPRDESGDVLPDELAELLSTITVRSVVWRDTDDGDGIVVTALRELDGIGTPLVLNTPFATPDLLPTDDLYLHLATLKEEARAYVRGKRLHADLFAGATITVLGGDGASDEAAEAPVSDAETEG